MATKYQDSLDQRVELYRFKPKCKGCGLKIRRPGHVNGPDHIRRAGKKASAA